MVLTLSIENETELVDGGPLTYTVTAKRGFDIGRDSHLDWTLPDPSRYISSKHCEVRYRDDGFWLHDVSTNGTYLNGDNRRMASPHKLRDGDRIEIGHYIIRIALDEDVPNSEAPPQPRYVQPVDDGMWESYETSEQEAIPEATQRLRKPIVAAPGGDFLDWQADWLTAPTTPRLAEPVSDVEPRQMIAQQDGEDVTRMVTPAPYVASPSERSQPITSTPRSRSQADSGSRVEPVVVRELNRHKASIAKPNGNSGGHSFLTAFAVAAGIPEELIAQHDEESLARLLGLLMRQVAEDLRQLLAARFEAKRMARSSSQTQIQGTDNNPLKFLPTVEDSLKVMFGPPSRSYLDAPQTFAESFADLKAHEVDTYSAMQAALIALTADFDPKKIEAQAEQSGGLGKFVGSNKARAWEIFVARWQAKTVHQDNGILGAFMEHFARAYDSGRKS